MRPVAGHPAYRERLLPREPGIGPEEIDEATTWWLLADDRLLALPSNGPRFHPDHLPLVPVPHPSRRP